MRFIVNHIINAMLFRNLMVLRILQFSERWQQSDFDNYFIFYIFKIQIQIIRPPSKTLTCFGLDARFLSFCMYHQRDARNLKKSFLCRRYIIVFPLIRDFSFHCIYRKREAIFLLTPNTQIFDWKKTRAWSNLPRFLM